MPENGRKNIFRHKQTTNKVQQSAYGKVTISLLDSVNKQAR